MKRLPQILGIGLFAAVASAVPAQAQWVNFHNVCSPGTFRVCASADVMIDASNNLVIRVWNMNQSTYGGSTATIADYSSLTGGWHTITAIGISNIGYTLSGSSTQLAASLINGGATSLTEWTAGADPTSAAEIQVYNTAASTSGHKEGIVGCLDPGPAKANHVATCANYGSTPYVEFTISGFSSINLAGAAFEFHSKQGAYADCLVFDPNNDRCTDNSFKGTSTEVVPEPITMILLGSGLLGVGGAAQRRRRRQLEIETA